MSDRRNPPDGRRRWPILLAAGAYAAWVVYLAAVAALHRVG